MGKKQKRAKQDALVIAAALNAFAAITRVIETVCTLCG